MDASDLLDAGPEGYTAARDAEVRRRRAAGDKAGTTALKGLARPSLALWAVLAAAKHEPDVALRATEATAALAAAQAAAAGGDSAADVATATAARRRALDAVRDAAVTQLAAHIDRSRAERQRDDTRAIADRVARHPALLAAWLDGTLRDVPDETGFEAFADLEPAPRSTRTSVRAARPKVARERDDAKQKAERQARARAAVDDAERALDAAEQRVADAERAVRAASAARDAAARELEAVRRAHAASS